MVQLDGLAAQPGRRPRHGHGALRFRAGLGLQCLVAGNALGGLGGPRLAAPHDPLRLLLQKLAALALAGGGHLQPLGLQLQVAGVLGVVQDQLSVVQFGDPVGHPVQEIAVVGDHHQRAGEPLQPLLQPGHHVAVQVVRGLVQHQDVRGVHEHAGQGHPLALAAGEGAHLLVEVGDAQLREDRPRFIFVQCAEFGGEVGEHLLHHGVVVVHPGRLGQPGQLHVGIAAHPAGICRLHPRQHLQERALAGAVHADQAQPVAGVQVQRHVLEQLPVAIVLGDVFSGQQHEQTSCQG